MIARHGRSGYECVVVDVNTQHDFCAAEGAKPVANVHQLTPALRRTIAWAKRNHVPVVSSIESRRLSETMGNRFNNFCIDGTYGQRKIGFTLFAQCAYVEVDNSPACPIDLFRRYQQVIFRKRSEDLLANPKADRFLTQVQTREFVLFGIGVEEGIKQLALGLLARHKHVVIVADASGYWNEGLADLALKKMRAKGATIITTEQLLYRKLDRSHRYFGFRRRSGNEHSHGSNGTRNGRSSNGKGRNEYSRPNPNSA